MKQDKHIDHTEELRAKLARNLSRIQTARHITRLHHRSIKHHLAQRQKEVAAQVQKMHDELAGDPSSWTPEDLRIYEELLAERDRLAQAMGETDADD